MRVPSPAASTTVRLDRAVILAFPWLVMRPDNGGWRPAVFNCFPPEIKPIRRPQTSGFKWTALFLLMFAL